MNHLESACPFIPAESGKGSAQAAKSSCILTPSSEKTPPCFIPCVFPCNNPSLYLCTPTLATYGARKSSTSQQSATNLDLHSLYTRFLRHPREADHKNVSASMHSKVVLCRTAVWRTIVMGKALRFAYLFPLLTGRCPP